LGQSDTGYLPIAPIQPYTAKPGKVWQPTPCSNLIRHVPSGTFFARLQVGGNLIRKSLQTDLLCIAKLRLADLDQPEPGFMKTRKITRPPGVVNSVSKFFFGAGSNLVILCRPKSEGNQTKKREAGSRKISGLLTYLPKNPLHHRLAVGGKRQTSRSLTAPATTASFALCRRRRFA